MMMMIITMMMVMIACLNGDGATAESKSLEQFKGQARLPKFAVPKHYDIFLKPDLDAFKFAGTVEITVDVVEDTYFLVLNVADLAIVNESVSFQGHSSYQKLHPSEIIAVEEDEILVLGFNDVLPYGEGILRMAFDGILLKDRKKGFYRSEYEYNGKKKFMAVTMFEPADARRCFPCWDEPALKATFKMTLEVPSDQVALSNMPVVKQEIEGNVKKLFYQESPIMSTYLVAVVVGLFDFIEASTIDGINVRVYCEFGKTSQGKFALDVAVKTLDLFKQYFAVPYPLPKLDMIAIPAFVVIGMENFGLVTFREMDLLNDGSPSLAENKQHVADVVTHELSHQWFGNLVTMEWWTYLWLNEGFATWLSYLAEDSLFPEWNSQMRFHDSTVSDLRLDALEEAHPIEFNINHASKIDAYFDGITYSKVASLIQMLQSYLGAESFQKSLASYVKRFAFSNVKSEDLWNVIEEESGVQVNILMDSWTKQKGFPVVHVTLRDEILELEQSRFLANGSTTVGEWIVPITLSCGSYATTKTFLLRTKSEQINASQLLDFSVANNKGKKARCLWIKFNVNQTGFYRVKYEGELETGIRYALDNNKLSAPDRFGILDDSYSLWMASKQNMSSLLFLMKAFREETDYTIISSLMSVTYDVASVIGDGRPELFGNITKFLVSLFQHSAKRLGWEPKEGDKPFDASLRQEILTTLIYFRDSITRDEGLKRFDAFLEDRNTSLLPANTRVVAYDAVMLAVNKTNRYGYDSLLKIYRETNHRDEKIRILRCLASSLDPDIVLEALNFILSSEVMAQDAHYGLSGLRREGREVAWKWFKENWDNISKTWGSSGFQVGYFVSEVISLFFSEEKADEIEAFFGNNVTPDLSGYLRRARESMRIRAKRATSIRKDDSLPDFIKELLKV